MRVCLLTNILPPYRLGFYNELARLTDLHVVLDSFSTPDREWKIDPASVQFRCIVSGNRHKAVLRPGAGYTAETRFFNFSKRTIPELRRIRPDIVIAAELGPRTIQAALYAFTHRIPLVCYWEGTPHTESRIPAWKRWVRRLLAARADAFWVNGTESAQYVRDLRVPDECVYAGMTGVDTSYFLQEAAGWYDKRDSERERQGLAGTVFVCSSSLSARKGIMAYLAAMRRLLELAPNANVSFLFIGDGEHRADVEAFARQHPRARVVITGFVQLSDLPRLYVCGDCFVLPTLEDCWPLATLEPLVCGLPQIFSRFNGAASDLSRWPNSGTTIDPLDREAFARQLLATVNSPAAAPSARTCAEVADFYAPAAQAQRALASCRSVLSAARLVPAALR